MGETWKGHDREKGDPTLNAMQDLHIITMKGDMTLQEKMALQMALAVHAYLARHKQSMESVDFKHPWGSTSLNKTEIMREWMSQKDGKSDSERLGDFIESLTTDATDDVVDIINASSRAGVLEKMNIDCRPLPPDTTPTVH